MCRLFGMSAGAKPARATFWLLGAPDSLSVQSRREPDGTGLGWFDGKGSPHVRKQAIAAHEDRAFGHEAREVCATSFIAHVRFASTGSLARRNTHPFEQDGRLFAHNGVIEGLAELEDRLGAARAMVQGDTDSERFFALITREIAARDGDVAGGIEAACRWVAATLPLLSINFVLATSRSLWALRYPDAHPLHLLERAAGLPLEHRSSLGSQVRSGDGAEQALAVLASEPMDDDPAWRMLDSGELVEITPALEVHSRRILDRPPARALTLAELSARAKSSQT